MPGLIAAQGMTSFPCSAWRPGFSLYGPQLVHVPILARAPLPSGGGPQLRRHHQHQRQFPVPEDAYHPCPALDLPVQPLPDCWFGCASNVRAGEHVCQCRGHTSPHHFGRPCNDAGLPIGQSRSPAKLRRSCTGWLPNQMRTTGEKLSMVELLLQHLLPLAPNGFFGCLA
jgi:hypothetical protein